MSPGETNPSTTVMPPHRSYEIRVMISSTSLIGRRSLKPVCLVPTRPNAQHARFAVEPKSCKAGHGLSSPKASDLSGHLISPSVETISADANLTNTRRNGDRQAGRGYRSKAAKTALSPFI
jgi:hypothetical protein